VPEYLVEVYVSRDTTSTSSPEIDEVSLAANELTEEGTPVRFLQSIYVPEDETGFYLFQALSVEAVREASVRAGLRCEHISEAVCATPG
jgi:hypothetical protein